MQLFHYHLVTSKVREVEARYLAKLGFQLVARYGRVEDEHRGYEPGVSWEELDEIGFKLRLSELERGAVNVVVQPGQWDLPRVDHWINELLDNRNELALAELHLRAQDPGDKAVALADLLGLEQRNGVVEIGETLVKFVPGGPQGRPELYGELFV